MPERCREVKVFRTEYMCPHCNITKMNPTGYSKPSSLPLIEHVCSQCGYTKFFNGITYPVITYEENIDF